MFYLTKNPRLEIPVAKEYYRSEVQINCTWLGLVDASLRRTLCPSQYLPAHFLGQCLALPLKTGVSPFASIFLENIPLLQSQLACFCCLDWYWSHLWPYQEWLLSTPHHSFGADAWLAVSSLAFSWPVACCRQPCKSHNLLISNIHLV